jgi:molecular chaperone DnaJ
MAADYYQLLGVAREADATEIKRAYRKRARELHPDVNPDDPTAEERFREVTAAYEVLSDDERRSIYDRYGEEGLKSRQWEPQFASFGSIADIFAQFFGGEDQFGGRGAGPARGESVHVALSLTFAEAALGAQKDVSFAVQNLCDTCDGRGAKDPSDVSSCEHCGGAGVVRQIARSLFGQVIQESACPVCGGRGEVIKVPCDTCAGDGVVAQDETITIEVPAGVEDGQRIRLTGRGHVPPGGGARGNLYVDVAVQADERFVREGSDLISVLDLTMTEAALGVTKLVETVDDEGEEVPIPAGIQSGEVMVLKGRGCGRLRGTGRGDQRVVISVGIPRDLTSDQRELLERFQSLESPRNYERRERILDKLRRVLRG